MSNNLPSNGKHTKCFQRCAHYIPKKKRACNFAVVPGQDYCGNHLALNVPSAAEKRVPCPYGNHDVLESQLAKHVDACPDRLSKLAREARAYHSPNINCGSGPDFILPVAPPELANGRGNVQSLSTRRFALAVRTGEVAFNDLLARIEKAAQELGCSSDNADSEELSVIEPEETERYLRDEESAPNRRFSKKHAQQQASIAGNMKKVGLVRPKEEKVTYVELGAGKGYLSLSLAHCFGIDRVALVDVSSFRLKADRAMRNISLERIKCDLADFDPNGLESLKNGGKWVAIGKHLCGPATDFALRCCVQNIKNSTSTVTPAASLGKDVNEQQQPSMFTTQDNNGNDTNSNRTELLGLAIATCCHHRCTWCHFVGRDILQQLGFSAEDFEIISWMTGWALCGHEAPAGEVSDGDSGANSDVESGVVNGNTDNVKNKRGALLVNDEDQQQQGAVFDAEDEEDAKPPPLKKGGIQFDRKQHQKKEANGTMFKPHAAIPRSKRIEIGQQCKKLLDRARLEWLKRQGFDADVVLYVPPQISGENRLLLAVPAFAAAKNIDTT